MVHDLTTGKIAPQLIRFTVPMVLGNLFQLTYNAVDAAIVGRYVSKEALAGVGTTNPVMSMLILLLDGLCVGTGVLMATQFGAHEEERLRRQVSTTMLSGCAFSLILTAVCLLLSSSILTLMQVDPSVYPIALSYMRIVLLGLVFSFFYSFLAATFRALGDTVTPLLFLAVSAVLNVAGDLLFVLKLGMGANGCGIATVVSQALSCLFCFLFIQAKIPILQLGRGWLTFDRALLSRTVAFAWTSAAQRTSVQFGKVVIQGMVNSISVTAAATFAAVNRVEDFAIIPEQNIAHAMSAFMAQNHGAGKDDRMRKGFLDGIRIELIYGTAMALVIFFFADQIIALFSEASDVRSLGGSFLRTIAFIYIVPGFSNGVQGYFRGIGELKVTLLSSLVNITARVLMAVLLVLVLKKGLLALPASYLFGWFCMMLTELPVLVRKLREGKEREERR